MTTTAHSGDIVEPLSDELIARTCKSLAQIYAAAHTAESLLDSIRSMPIVQVALERRSLAARSEHGRLRRETAEEAAADLMDLPTERWGAVLATMAPRQQKATLQRVLAAARNFTGTEPDRAHRLAGSILSVTRIDRLPPRAPLL